MIQVTNQTKASASRGTHSNHMRSNNGVVVEHPTLTRIAGIQARLDQYREAVAPKGPKPKAAEPIAVYDPECAPPAPELNPQSQPPSLESFEAFVREVDYLELCVCVRRVRERLIGIKQRVTYQRRRAFAAMLEGDAASASKVDLCDSRLSRLKAGIQECDERLIWVAE